MRKGIISILMLSLTGIYILAQSNDPVLMKINGKNVPLSEFEYIYNKNNSANTIDKKTLPEYVDLFVNFKLKVEEALRQGLDTVQSFKSEFGQYKSQLAEPYLTDKDATETLLREAYDRTKNEVEVSHIMIKIPAPGFVADTLAAYNKALNIWKRAQKEDFKKLATEVSEDPNVTRNSGYVGWINAFRTPYAFETAAYNTSAGSVSKPVRTFLGYHIIKVHSKKQSQGEVFVAHIMKFSNQNDSANKKTIAKQKIDSLYQRILAGDDFGALAEKYSDDKATAVKKGELIWFGVEQRMVPEFEEAAFALKNKGDVSKPVLSPYGWHIIKLLDSRPLQGFDEMKAGLENKLKMDERQQVIKNTFADKLKKEYHYQIDNDQLKDFQTLYQKTVSTDSVLQLELNKLNKPNFINFDGNSFSQTDFVQFLKNSKGYFNGIQADFLKIKLGEFANSALVKYETEQLNEKYPEYRYLLQEYHDGILLFDVSNKEVWEKSAKDEAGLKKHFESNKQTYNWQKPHYKGRIIYCKDKDTFNAAKKIVKNIPNDSIEKFLYARLNDSIQYVKIEKGLWTEGESKVIDSGIFKKEKYTPAKEYPYFFLTGKLLKNPEEYADVRGAVTTDYQNYLEKEWIDTLRKCYPVSVDENVLKLVKKN